MVKITKYWYFVIIAPILAKLVEWSFQLLQPLFFSTLKHLWLTQLIFILTLANAVFFISLWSLGKKDVPYHYIVGMAYFLKELYNFLFVFKEFSPAVAIALIVEPVFMIAVLGLFLPKFLPIKNA